jgi:hypothetical protein
MRSIRRSTVLLALSVLALAAGAPAPARAAGEDAALAAWGRVLAEHVEDGGVDYAALARERDDLDRYLRSLARARPAAMGKDEALAFWTNAYNAVVLHHVLERYPGMRSVEDVDGFFDELTFPVAGEELTLDEIEERGRGLGDARVHFAVVCASTSCPDLRGEPYQAGKIDAQLRDQTRRFLSDPSKGLRWEPEEDVLWLSSIFKWYAGDFTGGSTFLAFFARGGVFDWVVEHAPPEIAKELRGKDPSVRYLDYDWGLNDR